MIYIRVLFMGTPDFAVPCLKAVAAYENCEIVAVVTQPDKPKGRGHKLKAPPVKETAEELGIPVFQPPTLKNNSFSDELLRLDPDVIIVVAYGQILPEYVLNYPKYGCVNVHGSLLPKYRGAAPIQRCIIDGEKTTGVTTMYMDKTLDTGDMILKSEVEIGENETAGELFDRLSVLGGELIVETIKLIENGTAPRVAQDDTLSSYAAMMTKETGHIDWSKSSSDVINLIRGVNPWPLAYSDYCGNVMKIFVAEHGGACTSGVPGEIVGIRNKKIEVCCGDANTVLIKELQFKGGKRMDTASYLNGHDISIGEILK